MAKTTNEIIEHQQIKMLKREFPLTKSPISPKAKPNTLTHKVI
jgi:capsular polysaccharide biosynthesis protein